MKTLIAVLFFVLFTSACTGWKSKKVSITKDYVINPNWDKTDNSFGVYRMKLKDSSKTIELKDPTEFELYHGLVEDTSFHTLVLSNTMEWITPNEKYILIRIMVFHGGKIFLNQI